jgi:hypothetical protein
MLKCIIFPCFSISKYFNEIEDKTEKDIEFKDIKSNSSLMDKYLRDAEIGLLNFPHKRLIKQIIYKETDPFSFINLSTIEVFSNFSNLEFIKAKMPFESILMTFSN